MTHAEKRRIQKKVEKLYIMFHDGKIPTLVQHEVHPELEKGSRENFLYFTLAPSLNFQRNSPALWHAAFATYADQDTQYLFFPEEVMKRSRDEIQRDLLKHKLALQRNKHTDIWIAISRVFLEEYQGDPRVFFRQADWDVVKIQRVILLEKKKLFPYLSGPKMANYWLYILSQYTDSQFKNMHEISIIPDTHVLQSTVKLGITERVSAPLLVAQVWKEVLQDMGITPVAMHPVLWNWSRNNFLPEV